MTAYHIGVTPQSLALAIKQGESGPLRIAIPASKANGDPLDTYEGFTAELALLRTAQGEPELDLDLTVTGDEQGRRFVIDVNFSTELTEDKRVGELFGDLTLIEPGGQRHYPLNVTLTIERSYATKGVG